MSIVQSGGELVPIRGPFPVAQSNFLRLNSSYIADYEAIYRTQPSVRTVISFLARNVAQLGIGVFRRISDTDREHLGDHPLADTLERPGPDTTRYELIDALMNDLGIWDAAYWLKVPRTDSDAINLLRLPPPRVEVLVNYVGQPMGYRVGNEDVTPDRVVHFRGYSPSWGSFGVPPMETLRRILAEDISAAEYREQFWRTGARVSTVIKRPAGIAWSAQARERFRDEWRDTYSGDGPGAGGTPLLEDGMELQSIGFNAEQSQYIEARKLSREEVAAAFHIPPPMVGILEHATFSNIVEQHQNLYQDTLGPYLTMISERIGLRLIPDWPDSDDVYCEFNLQEKLRGSFEQQVASLQTSVGGPWITRNEARARQNLPAVEGGDDLITPLNVTAGGQASPTDSAPPPTVPLPAGASRSPGTKARHADAASTRFAALFRRHFRSQRDVILGASSAGIPLETALDSPTWNEVLGDELAEANEDVGVSAARHTLRLAGLDPAVEPTRYQAWLKENAKAVARATNDATARGVSDAVAAPPDGDVTGALADLFSAYVEGRADTLGVSQASNVVGYGSTTAASDAGLATKSWVVTSSSPRPSHARMDGETVDVGDEFSNGARWPGDGQADIGETAGCTCDLTYQTSREEVSP